MTTNESIICPSDMIGRSRRDKERPLKREPFGALTSIVLVSRSTGEAIAVQEDFKNQVFTGYDPSQVRSCSV
jgi:hypothetical protein